MEQVGDAEERSQISALREQHGTIQDLAEAMRRRLAEGRGLGDSIARLTDLIAAHERAEEGAVPPLCRSLLTPGARAAAVQALERWMPVR